MSKGYIEDDLFDKKEKEKQNYNNTITQFDSFLKNLLEGLSNFVLEESDFNGVAKCISAKVILENKLEEITDILSKHIDKGTGNKVDETIFEELTNNLLKSIDLAEDILLKLKEKD